MERGGWIPILNRRGRQAMQQGEARGRLVTLFVDNLPHMMDPKGLFQLFSKFGVVKDVFIPNKRRKMTNSRFGFVRFDCPVAARVAIQKANGLWIDDKALAVKDADYGKANAVVKNPTHVQIIRSSVPSASRMKDHDSDGQVRSYADMVKGKEHDERKIISIRAKEIGTGWLNESMVLRLKPEFANLRVNEALEARQIKNVLIREGGGRTVVLTFSSEEDKVKHMQVLNVWLKDWCEFITEWKPGCVIAHERYVWLSCHGIPLNLWSCDTITKIGRIWGDVVNIEGNMSHPESFVCCKVRIATKCMDPINFVLNLECNGYSCPVRVLEDHCSCNKTIKKDIDHSFTNLADYNSVNQHGEYQAKADCCSKIGGGRKSSDEEVRVTDDMAAEVASTAEVAAGSEATPGGERREEKSNASWVSETMVNSSKKNIVKPNEGSCSAVEESMLMKLPRKLHDESRMVSDGEPSLTSSDPLLEEGP